METAHTINGSPSRLNHYSPGDELVPRSSKRCIDFFGRGMLVSYDVTIKIEEEVPATRESFRSVGDLLTHGSG